MTDKLEVLVVDDDPLFRKMIKKYIRHHEDRAVIEEASDLHTALQSIAKGKPGIVLVDMLGFEGEEGGIQVIKKIQAKYNKLPILAISSHDSSLYAETALNAGARGYLMKQEAAEKVGSVILQILNGGMYVSGGEGEAIIRRHQKNNSPQLNFDF